MEDAYGEEGDTRSLSPREGFTPPDATDFFNYLEKMFNGRAQHTDTYTSDYRYQDTHGYGWLAWGMLYIAIPEYDTYERHEGEWACMETLVEAVQQCQHASWRREQDTREFIEDMKHYLSKL